MSLKRLAISALLAVCTFVTHTSSSTTNLVFR